MTGLHVNSSSIHYLTLAEDRTLVCTPLLEVAVIDRPLRPPPRSSSTMFSAEDAKDIFQSLSLDGSLSNPLILASHGDGFVTRTFARRAFESIVTQG